MYSDRKYCRTHSEHVNYLLPNIKFLVNLCKNDYEIVCNGAVVHRYWVITAATCFTKYYSQNDNITSSTYFITRSYIPRNVNEDYKKRKFHIKDAFIHPFLKNGTNLNNFALLKMAEPVTDAYTTSIKLPPRIFFLHPAINCTIIGYCYDNSKNKIALKSGCELNQDLLEDVSQIDDINSLTKCTITKEIMKTQSNKTCKLMEGSVLICFPNVHYMQSILVDGEQNLFLDLGRFREWIENTVLGIDQFNVKHKLDFYKTNGNHRIEKSSFLFFVLIITNFFN